MIKTVEVPRFDVNEALLRIDGKPVPYFSQYWQRIFSGVARTINNLIASRNTGLTAPVATGTAVNHGMTQKPKFVTLVPQDATPTNYFADTITATQFTVHFTGVGNHAFGWTAET